MSATPQGEGWWQASDGQWYPPELHPDAQAAGTGQAPATDGGGREGWWQASDGEWYPPELHPDAQASADASTPQDPATDGSPSGSGGSEGPPAGSGRETVVVQGTPPAGDASSNPPPASPPGQAPPAAQPPGAQPPGQAPPAAQPPGAQPPGQAPSAPGTQPAAGPPPSQPPGGGQPPTGPPPGQPPGAPPTAQAPQGPGGPPPGQPPPGGPPPAGGAGGGQKRRTGRIVLIILLVLLLAAGLFGVSVLVLGDEAAADVLLEPIGDARDDAFTESVAPEPGGSLLDYAAGTGEHDGEVSDVGYRTADGSVPGIYGGSLNESSCDADLLGDFLVAEPEKAEAWAGVVQISPQDIPAYLASLTPVNLAGDTRVLNHGFVDGEAQPRESVLQRGSAVLIDSRGVPRVDCYSGGPLLEPTPVGEESFTGEQWAAFQRDRVLVIDDAPEELETFDLEDVETGELFARPAGSRGDADRPGTVELTNDGSIEFDRTYEDFLVEGRSEARYLLDAPDGAIMTIRVDNRRDSERRIRTRIVSEGSEYVDFRLSPGASDEATIVLDNEGGGQFEVLFNEGPAAYDFEIGLSRQADAGQDGDAGGEFDTAFEITSGQQVQGQLGGQDDQDLYLIEVQPGSLLTFEADVARASDRRARFRLNLEGDGIFGERVSPGSSTSGSMLFSGEESGILEILVNEGPSNYTFTAAFEEQQDGGEPGDAGDELADAREIPTGEALTGQIGQRDPQDWYLFNAPAGNVEIALENDVESPRRFRARVQDEDGSNVAGTRVNPGSDDVLAFEAEPNQQYRLFFNEGRADYAFEIRELAPQGEATDSGAETAGDAGAGDDSDPDPAGDDTAESETADATQ